MPRATAGDSLRRKIADGGPYVHLDGGPFHGCNYRKADWDITREAERWGIEDAGEQREPVLTLYRETKRIKAYYSEHPTVPGLTAVTWDWSGKREPLNPLTGRRAR